MKCLSEEQIALVATGGASDEIRAHVGTCQRCERRVEEANLLTSLSQSLDEVPGPPAAMTSRLENALRASSPAGGATKLVEKTTVGSRRRIWRYAVATSFGVAVAAVVLVSGIPTEPEVSASRVLAQTLAVWSEGQGAELTKYELVLEGSARLMSSEITDGTSVIEELVDHEEEGRYHVYRYGPNGELVFELAQDPLQGVRTARAQIGDKGYFFQFSMTEPPPVGAPELTRSVIQTGIALMQASGDPKLTTFDVAEGTRYQIELPQVTSNLPDVPWELTAAKVVIDASDFRVLEFEASGTFMGHEGRASYRLIHHEIKAPEDLAPTAFIVEPQPGDRQLEGVGTDVPGRDVVRVILEALDAS